MAPYKEDHYLIIQPGSSSTLIQFGLNQDSLTLPAYRIPTKVYKDGSGGYTSQSEDESMAVFPIAKGQIIDGDAFNHFLRVILRSVLQLHPVVLTSNIAFLLVVPSTKWSKLCLERITNYVYEKMGITAFNIAPVASCANFAYGGTNPDAAVVNIGKEYVEVVPVIDYQPMSRASVIVRGSALINNVLSSVLPQWSAEQIEALKTSPIYEILNEEDSKNSFFGKLELEKPPADAEEEGVLDIAAIVTDDNKVQVDERPNSELETNYFEFAGKRISVGKERFQGFKPLLEEISFAVGQSLNKVQSIAKRKDCWNNIIVLGGTTKIKGFKEALLIQLFKDHLIYEESASQGSATAAELAFRNDNSVNGKAEGLNFQQVPQTIGYSKFPEYFPEWKSKDEKKQTIFKLEDASFLGAQILSKQFFGGDIYLHRDEFNSKGPISVWEYVI